MKKIWIALPLVVLAACVTANVYFPAAPVQQAADKIIQEIWQPLNTHLDLKGGK